MTAVPVKKIYVILVKPTKSHLPNYFAGTNLPHLLKNTKNKDFCEFYGAPTR